MKSEEEINHFYKTRLNELVLPLELYRKKKVILIRQRMVLVGTIIPLCFFVIIFPSEFIALTIVFLIAVITVSFGLIIQPIQKLNASLRRSFKSQILPKLLDFLFDDFTYIPRQRIATKVLRDSLLIDDDIIKVEGEDYMRFKLGETAIHFCETKVYGGSESTVFQGTFISTSFNKQFKSQTLVLPRSLKNKRRFIFSKLKKVDLEDIVFEKAFMVLSSDQVESRYILTTSMMKRMLDYKLKTGKQIAFSFTGNLLHCTIPNYINLFEPALFDSFMDTGYLKKSLDALRLYTDIVNDLNLNLRIWSKS